MLSISVLTIKTSAIACWLTYSVTDPISIRSTAFKPVAPITIKLLCWSVMKS